VDARKLSDRVTLLNCSGDVRWENAPVESVNKTLRHSSALLVKSECYLISLLNSIHQTGTRHAKAA
jgi:hypothetical protein